AVEDNAAGGRGRHGHSDDRGVERRRGSTAGVDHGDGLPRLRLGCQADDEGDRGGGRGWLRRHLHGPRARRDGADAVKGRGAAGPIAMMSASDAPVAPDVTRPLTGRPGVPCGGTDWPLLMGPGPTSNHCLGVTLWLPPYVCVDTCTWVPALPAPTSSGIAPKFR